jgi:hypothetical protein
MYFSHVRVARRECSGRCKTNLFLGCNLFFALVLFPGYEFLAGLLSLNKIFIYCHIHDEIKVVKSGSIYNLI